MTQNRQVTFYHYLMRFSIIGSHFTAWCPIKKHPDQANDGPANQRIDNHRNDGSDLQDMILESRVGHNVLKRPEEQITQLIHKRREKTSGVRANQNHSDSK